MANFSRSKLSYRDVHQAFEQSVEKGSVTLTFPTPQAATTFCGRANAYRRLLREDSAKAGGEYESPFDHMMVSRKPKDIVVNIVPRGFNFTMSGPDGQTIELNQVAEPVVMKKPPSEADFLAEIEKDLGSK